MCEPTTIATTALSIVSTGAQMYGQHQEYKMAGAQAEAQNRMYRQNRENTYQALGHQYGDINRRQSQEQQRAAEDKEEVSRRARADMSRARVAAGEAGVSGNSVKLGFRNISGTAARDRSTIDRNLQWTLADLQRQKQTAKTGAVNRINSVQRGQKPSTGSLVAGLGSTAARGYLNYQSMQPGNSQYGRQGGAGRYTGGYFRRG